MICKSASTQRSVLALVLLAVASFAAPLHVNLKDSGKNIQKDGFLLEWDLQRARRLPRHAMRWDVQKTPQGCAGYFFIPPDSCSPGRRIRFEASRGSAGEIFEVPGFSAYSAETRFYTLATDTMDGENRYILEWLIPWQVLAGDDHTRPSSLRVLIIDSCRKAIDTVEVGFDTDPPSTGSVRRAISPFLLLQLLAVAIIFALYLNLRSRIRRMH